MWYESFAYYTSVQVCLIYTSIQRVRICRSHIVCICVAHMSVYVGRIRKSVYRVCMWVTYYKSVGSHIVCICGAHMHVGHILQVCLWVAYEYVCGSHTKECVQSVYVGHILQECARMSYIQMYQKSVYM